MSEPDSFSAHQRHNQIKQEAAAKALGAKGSTDWVPSSSTSFACHPFSSPRRRDPPSPQKSESLLWVRGQGRYSEGDSSVLGAGMPSARNLSQSLTAASQGDTQQSWSSDQQHLLDKHSGTRLNTKNLSLN